MPGRKANVALVSSYVPRQCGIAAFAHDLATNLADYIHRAPVSQDDSLSIIAINDRDDEYQYDPQVHFEIRQHQRSDYHNAADFLNTSNADVINLQHEYGLFGGGEHGPYIIDLLERLKKPLVTTFHTVLAEPTDEQREVLSRIGQLSHRVVVLAERAKMLCEEIYDIPADKVHLIHHGTPDVEFHNPDDFKARFMVKGRPVIMTFGLLSPTKGIEIMLDALTMVVRKHPNVAYMIVGATHPGVKRESGESYRLNLESRAVDRGVAKNVLFHNHYVTQPVLIEFLKATDIYVTPYLSKEQIVSGTLAYAVACGKAIVSTPYWYAQEMLADGRGRLAEFNDAESLAQAINELLDNPDLRLKMQKNSYAFGRQMIWPAVAKKYDKTYRQLLKEFGRRVPAVARAAKPSLRLTLPEVRLDHLYRLTDDTGILQHAIYSTPNRHHGYCTDDNARALLVAVMSYRFLNDSAVLPYLDRYQSFLHHSWNPQLKRFRNAMSFDRKWLDKEGTDDCLARCIWALGYLIANPPARQDLPLAIELFNQAAESTRPIRFPRSQALCILGFSYYLRHFDEARNIQELMESKAQDLLNGFKENRSEDWVWLEDSLTYNNARIAQSLILAGRVLERDDMLQCGLDCLHWLLKTHTSPEGNISLVGNRGWWPRHGQKAQFDQQPIDAAALIGACKSAYKSTEDQEWLAHMRRCFEWFLGRNDLDTPLADFKTRGCCDGLHAEGVNLNQGAESTLSWLLALLTMYEMHPGQPPTNGDKLS